MYHFYDDGFEPLYPFYRETDKDKTSVFVEKKIKRMGGGNITSRGGDNTDIQIKKVGVFINFDFFIYNKISKRGV